VDAVAVGTLFAAPPPAEMDAAGMVGWLGAADTASMLWAGLEVCGGCNTAAAVAGGNLPEVAADAEL
jgi:hypothetical protein